MYGRAHQKREGDNGKKTQPKKGENVVVLSGRIAAEGKSAAGQPGQGRRVEKKRVNVYKTHPSNRARREGRHLEGRESPIPIDNCR